MFGEKSNHLTIEEKKTTNGKRKSEWGLVARKRPNTPSWKEKDVWRP